MKSTVAPESTIAGTRILLLELDKSTGIRRCKVVLSTADTVQAVIDVYITDGGGDDREESGESELIVDRGGNVGPCDSAAAQARFNLNAALRSL